MSSFEQLIPGVSVEVHFGGSTLHPRSSDGKLAGINAEGTAVVSAYVNPGVEVYACHVDHGYNVTRKRAVDSTDPARPEHTMFRVKMRINRGDSQDNLYIAYPLNHFRMFTISQTGEVRFWEVAIVSQEEQFYLSIQDTGVFQAYQGQDTVVWPDSRMASWPQMCELLEDAVRTLKCELPTYEDQTVLEPVLPEDLEDDEGLVLWFNVAQGYGAMHTNQGVARVHWSAIPDEKTLRRLFPNDFVYFDELDKPHQTTNRSTAFPLEAKAIEFGEIEDDDGGDEIEDDDGDTLEVKTKVVPVTEAGTIA